jgi:polysaccharide biosynthesis transport protein
MTGPLDDARAQREGSSLVSGLRVVRERWPIVLASVVVCVGIAMAFALTATKQYDASARLLFRSSNLTSLIDPTTANSADPQRDQGTNLLLVSSSAVATRVKRALKLPDSPDDLLDQVEATSEPETDLINITATDPDPSRAAALANGFAEQFVAYRRDADRNRIAAGENLLRQQLNQLPASSTAERAELNQALQKVIALRAVTTGDAEVVDRAGVPTLPSSPRLRRDAVLSLVLGLVVGLALAFLVDLFDRRVKSLEEFEELFGLRALAAIPERDKDPATARERQAVLEPFRMVHNGLVFLGAGRDLRVIMVTSAVPGEGKSTVSAGLARAAALAGQRVALIETDMRRPTFHQQFELGDNPRGLTDVLVGGVSAGDVLHQALPGLPNLSVMPSGGLPPNSAELLRSAEMSALLAELAAEFDLVVLDAPPLLPVVDAQVLLDHPQVEAYLMVARVFSTTRDEARRARVVLERHGLRTVGLVINGLHGRDGYDYYGATESPGQTGPVRVVS